MSVKSMTSNYQVYQIILAKDNWKESLTYQGLNTNMQQMLNSAQSKGKKINLEN